MIEKSFKWRLSEINGLYFEFIPTNISFTNRQLILFNSMNKVLIDKNAEKKTTNDANTCQYFGGIRV